MSQTNTKFPQVSKRSLPYIRFWASVAICSERRPNMDTDCWTWRASTRGGYGQFYANGKQQGAHRFSWVLRNGPIPAGMHVLHECDNPSCVNPAHLFLGTVADNMRDRDRKGRNGSHLISGEANANSKLTASKVLSIVGEARSGSSHRDLAKKYGVSQPAITHILTGKTWRRVTGIVQKSTVLISPKIPIPHDHDCT